MIDVDDVFSYVFFYEKEITSRFVLLRQNQKLLIVFDTESAWCKSFFFGID